MSNSVEDTVDLRDQRDDSGPSLYLAEGDNGLTPVALPSSPEYEAVDINDPRFHTWDNGRRCHQYCRDWSPYYLPNDEAEQDRMELLHEMWKRTLDGKLCISPIENPNRVLDVGTGTGIWAVEFADNYPQTHVTGTDLSPIQPNFVPPNVQFELVDCSETWHFESFDFIFVRDAALWVRDWSKFLRQAYQAMEPGAMIEFQTVHFPWTSEHPNSDASDPSQHSQRLVTGARKLGINLLADKDLKKWLKQAGFINYKEKKYAWSTSYTGKDKKRRELTDSNVRNLQQGLEAYSKGFMVHGLGWSPERVELSLIEVRRRLSDKMNPVRVSASICYAQKPPRQCSSVSEGLVPRPPPFKSADRLLRLDCPRPYCERRGPNAFTNVAHLMEHLSKSHRQPYCGHANCRDASGLPNKLFTRWRDVQRHCDSVHSERHFRCLRPRCDRKYSRKDHLVEHQRSYHKQKIPKRSK